MPAWLQPKLRWQKLKRLRESSRPKQQPGSEELAPEASRERAKAIELEISHDMSEIVKAISEVCGDSGRWVHFGATSNDMLDTATGLQLRQALTLR